MRVFKTKWFAREARSHAITDEELCRAILETEQGKADALGGYALDNIGLTSPLMLSGTLMLLTALLVTAKVKMK
jgi:hypothetical protein